jgi:hypothetical protein
LYLGKDVKEFEVLVEKKQVWRKEHSVCWRQPVVRSWSRIELQTLRVTGRQPVKLKCVKGGKQRS